MKKMTLTLICFFFLISSILYINVITTKKPYADTSMVKIDPHPNRSHTENLLFATPENSVFSPSGKYILKIEERFHANTYNNYFIVYDIDKNEQVFVSDKYYRTRDRLYFLWGENDDIWVYSGDVGINLYHNNDNVWKETIPNLENIPELLAETLDSIVDK